MERPRSRIPPRLAIAVVLALISLCGYYSKRQVNSVTGEVQHTRLTPAQEIELGAATAANVAAEFGGPLRDQHIQRYVERVGQRMVAQTAARSTPYAFRFTVLRDSRTVNAFALPGGPIFVTAALLALLNSEAELAGVLGHEVGHVVARHSAEHLAKAELTQGLVRAASVAASDGYGSQSQLAAVAGQLIALKYGRNDELESDALGVKFLSQSGYDPSAMGDVMRALQRAAPGSRQPQFLASHPDPGNRAEKISALLSQYPPSTARNEQAYRQQVLERLAGAVALEPSQLEGINTRIPASAANQLPPEATEVLRRIANGGPFVSQRDGIEFYNREGVLPSRRRGYYREYTVPTPGSADRGARRIVAGANGELFYTDDHYRSFTAIEPVP
jgi:beta-barrel assembly-enhancing protease